MVQLARKEQVDVLDRISLLEQELQKLRAEVGRDVPTAIPEQIELPQDAIRHIDFCRKYGIAKNTLSSWIARHGLESFRRGHKERYVSESAALAILHGERRAN